VSSPPGTALSSRLEQLVTRAEQDERLDNLARPLADAVGKARSPAVVDLISGSWLGHPLHPVLTDLPIGFWTSAWVLDLVGGRRRRAAAQTLVGLGVLSAIPTAITGLSDWSDTVGGTRRIGVVHAAANTAALGLYTSSWLARRRGRHATGVMLGFAGAAAATLAAYFGGHLVYRTGTGVDVNAFTEPVGDWVAVENRRAASAPGAYVGTAGDDQVLLTSDNDQWHGIGDRCSHRGGPLHEGEIAAGCVTCPWHGSQFRTDDGSLVRGPAIAAQPRYEVRSQDDTLQVRAAG
jgi:nitrite reductase/ring-hydroxylating ferredoxin subunit/uncharacterized membrane protein